MDDNEVLALQNNLAAILSGLPDLTAALHVGAVIATMLCHRWDAIEPILFPETKRG